MEYAVSGLENPLTYLLITVFCMIYLQNKRTHKWLFWLSFIVALSMLNRLDTLLLYAPALLYALWLTSDKKKAIKYIAFGALPIIIWEIFSLLYYGYLIPNTAYAKLSTGISVFAYIEQGIYYFVDSISTDPVTLLAVIIATILTVRAKEKRYLALVAGMLLYVLYILKIGGDFMSGRFFTAPFILAVVTMSSMISMKKKAAYICVIGLCIYGLLNPLSPIRNNIDCENIKEELIAKNPRYYNYGITDERWFYYCKDGLMSWFDGVDMSVEKKQKSEDIVYQISANIGKYGYYAASNEHLIDVFALADPLLSHINIIEKRGLNKTIYGWRIGHFYRPLPFGYVETLKGGVNVIQSEKIAKLYDVVTIITRGNIFSVERLKAILNMNLGRYDEYSDFSGDVAFTDIDEIGARSAFDSPFSSREDRWYYAETVIVDLHGKQFVKSMDVSLNSSDNYEITYMNGDEDLASMVVKDLPNPHNTDGLTPYTFDVPEQILSTGFDKLRIAHTNGPTGFYLGRVVLNQDSQ